MIPKNPHKEMFVKIAYKMLFKPYIWGGDGANVEPDGELNTGYDCSGMVIECLKSVGKIKLDTDYTADGLYKELIKTGAKQIYYAKKGVIAFWQSPNSGKFYHTAICLNSNYCLTADGGGDNTKTRADAMRDNAFIKIRRIDHRIIIPQFLELDFG